MQVLFKGSLHNVELTTPWKFATQLELSLRRPSIPPTRLKYGPTSRSVNIAPIVDWFPMSRLTRPTVK